MSISRRKLIHAASTFAVGFAVMFKTGAVKSSNWIKGQGYQLHDDVSVSLLKTYARSLALEDKDARWEAQMMFHEAQLARRGGGTRAHVLGYQHDAFVAQQEGKVLTESQLFHLSRR